MLIILSIADWKGKVFGQINHPQLSNVTNFQNEQNIENDNIFIPSTLNCPDVNHARRHEIPRAQKAIKKSIEEEILKTWNTKVEKLTMQGGFVNLLIQEKENVTWQSLIKNAPRGIMSFALNSATG